MEARVCPLCKTVDPDSGFVQCPIVKCEICYACHEEIVAWVQDPTGEETRYLDTILKMRAILSKNRQPHDDDKIKAICISCDYFPRITSQE